MRRFDCAVAGASSWLGRTQTSCLTFTAKLQGCAVPRQPLQPVATFPALLSEAGTDKALLPGAPAHIFASQSHYTRCRSTQMTLPPLSTVG